MLPVGLDMPCRGLGRSHPDHLARAPDAPDGNIEGRMKRVNVVVTGRVQGVFFRATCAREARARGLSGWVRNRADGAVAASFEGRDEDVDAMVGWCREGPPYAVVDAVEVTSETPTGERGFEARG